jgi:hypothetical protein
VADVEGVGHQPPRRDRRHPQPGAELGGGELGDLRRPLPTGPADLLTARLRGFSGVEGVGVVEVGVLQRDLEDLHFQPALPCGQTLGMIEELCLPATPRSPSYPCDHLGMKHRESTPADPTSPQGTLTTHHD